MSEKEPKCLHCSLVEVIQERMDELAEYYEDNTGPYVMSKLAEVVAHSVASSTGHEVEAMMKFMEALSEQMNRTDSDGPFAFEMVQLDQRDPGDKEAIKKMDEVHEMTKRRDRGTIQ